MQFFKLAGAFAAGSGGQGRKRTADENVDLLAAKSEAFNKGLRGRAFFYVVNASGGTFTAMAVQKDPRMNINPQFPAYTEALGVKLTDIHAEEISLHAACNLLHRASQSDYIEDDDDVLEALDLDYMINRRFSDFCSSGRISWTRLAGTRSTPKPDGSLRRIAFSRSWTAFTPEVLSEKSLVIPSTT